VTLPTPIPSANVANIANAQDGEEGFRDIDEILNAANPHDGEELVVAAPKRGRPKGSKDKQPRKRRQK
jgi:hypothetical protein